MSSEPPGPAASPAPEDGLWAYCLALYDLPGVAADCLALQDRWGADVDLLLYACWVAGRRDAPLTKQDFVPLIDATQPWQQQVTGQLRAARRALKSRAESLEPEAYQDLRARILDAELTAEKMELRRLAEMAPPGNTARPAAEIRTKAAANIRAYLATLSVTPDEAAEAAIDRIAAAAGELQGGAGTATA